MVTFVCDSCGDTVTKPRIKKHIENCVSFSFSCVDCNKVFFEDVHFHSSCISEKEKYEKSLFKCNSNEMGKKRKNEENKKKEEQETNKIDLEKRENEREKEEHGKDKKQKISENVSSDHEDVSALIRSIGFPIKIGKLLQKLEKKYAKQVFVLYDVVCK